MEDFKVQVGVELDESSFSALKTKISGVQVDKIKLSMDASDVTNQLKSIQKQINGLSKIKIRLEDVGSGGRGSSTGLTKTVSEMNKSYSDLVAMANKISNLEIKIGGLKSLGGKDNQIQVLEQQLESLKETYENLSQTFSNFDKLSLSNLDVGDLQNLQSAVDKGKQKLEELDAKVIDTRTKLAEGIALKLDNGTFDNDLSRITSSYDKLADKTRDTRNAMSDFNSAFDELKIAKASGDVDKIIVAYDNYENALKNVKNQIDINTRAEQQMLNAEKLSQAKTALSSSMDVWLKRNSAAAKEFGAKIQELKAQIESADGAKLNQLKSEFQEVTREAELAGKSGLTFADTFKNQVNKLGTYFSAAMMFSQSIRALRSMYENVKSVDTAMTELYRVTDLSQTQYTQLYKNMANSAREYGTTLDGIITSTASWVRLGFDSNDANRLAEITAMYQHVTDLDENTAVKNLVTAYKGFEEQLLALNDGDATKAVEMVADIYDKLGNEFAESAGDVGEGLSKTASVLAEGGASIQEAAGMFTGINEVLQDSSTSGSALKILTLRIRGRRTCLHMGKVHMLCYAL